MTIRVVAYVDGFNLYHGLKAKGWKRFYWLNVQALAQQLIKPGQTLTATKYFTTVVKRPEESRLRQAVYLEALQTLPDFHLQYGHFLEDTVTCRQCGHSYVTHHEKMTDVNLSVELMTDAFQDRFDLALVISADSDLVGPLVAVRRLFGHKRFLVAFPPERTSASLKKAAHATLHIGHNELSKSLFPATVVKEAGVVLERPAGWGGEPVAKGKGRTPQRSAGQATKDEGRAPQRNAGQATKGEGRKTTPKKEQPAATPEKGRGRRGAGERAAAAKKEQAGVTGGAKPEKGQTRRGVGERGTKQVKPDATQKPEQATGKAEAAPKRRRRSGTKKVKQEATQKPEQAGVKAGAAPKPRRRSGKRGAKRVKGE